MAAVAGLAALTGTGSAWWWHRRAQRAEVQVVALRNQLAAARHAADHDALTGLPNRRAFLRRAEAVISDPARHPLAVVVVDLDDFKNVNDEWGHAAGDEVLMTVAHRLAARAADGLVARLGGDEFAGVWNASTLDARALGRDADRVAQVLAVPMPIADRTLTVTASVGMASVRPRGDLLAALHVADLAMYQAKTTRRGSHPTRPNDEIRRVAVSHGGHLTARHEAVHHDRHSRPLAHR